MLSWFFLLFPYMSFEYEMLMLPYMTNGLKRMYDIDIRESKSTLGSIVSIVECFAVGLLNKTFNAGLKNLNERGILTNYWVVNDEDEFLDLAKKSCVMSLMTDKPTTMKPLLFKAGMTKKDN